MKSAFSLAVPRIVGPGVPAVAHGQVEPEERPLRASLSPDVAAPTGADLNQQTPGDRERSDA